MRIIAKFQATDSVISCHSREENPDMQPNMVSLDISVNRAPIFR